MSQFRCVIQEGGNANARRSELERRLQHHHSHHYPDEQPSISWVTVPSGYMFTEGQQSTSSIVSCYVDHETTFDHRESYMRGVCDLWTEVTECTDHEVVVSLTETVNANQE